MSATVYDMTGRRIPPVDMRREAQLKHIEMMLGYLRMRAQIIECQIETYERDKARLETASEREWKEYWG